MLHKLAPSSLYCISAQILGHSLFLKIGGAKLELDVDALDVYFNLTFAITQLVNKIVPWKGAREEDFESMQNSIDALTTPSYVILDAYSST
jgi:hypothetical protein